MKVLLDTVTLIDLLKGDPKATTAIENIKSSSVFCTSTVNTYEIIRGIKSLGKNESHHERALMALLDALHLLQFDFAASSRAAEVYAKLRKKGISIDEPDYLIAGVCLSNGITTILTRNEKHFKNIKELKVLSY